MTWGVPFSLAWPCRLPRESPLPHSRKCPNARDASSKQAQLQHFGQKSKSERLMTYFQEGGGVGSGTPGSSCPTAHPCLHQRGGRCPTVLEEPQSRFSDLRAIISCPESRTPPCCVQEQAKRSQQPPVHGGLAEERRGKQHLHLTKRGRVLQAVRICPLRGGGGVPAASPVLPPAHISQSRVPPECCA